MTIETTIAAGEPSRSISLLERSCDTIHKAIQVIHTWHGHEAWGIYWEHAPEMRPIREEYDRLCAELKAAKDGSSNTGREAAARKEQTNGK